MRNKRWTPDKWQLPSQANNNENYGIYIYTHSHEQSENSPTKIKYNRLTQWTKEIKNYIYHLRTKLKHKLEDKTKARCQVGNKTMKTKLTLMLRGKERKKRKNRYAKLNRGR